MSNGEVRPQKNPGQELTMTGTDGAMGAQPRRNTLLLRRRSVRLRKQRLLSVSPLWRAIAADARTEHGPAMPASPFSSCRPERRLR